MKKIHLVKHQKKILTILLTATLGLTTLTSCGNTSAEKDSGNDSTNSNSENVTINFWHHYSAQSPENETLTNVLIPKFEEENPGIKVNAVSHEWADLHEKILISAQSDTLPDVARLDSAWVPEFQKMGILSALDEEMDDFQDVSDGLLESAMSTAKIGDHYYGLALNTNTKILFINSEAFEKAGLSAPTTMDEFKDDAIKLSGNNDDGQQVWGFDEAGLAGWNLCPFIWSMGGSITNEEQTKASGYINSPETVKAIEMLADLSKNDAATGWNSGDIPMTDGFGTGRYMMIFEGPWKISEMEGAYPDFKYETSAIPAGDAGSISVLGGEDIGMLNDSNKDASLKFIKFMTSEYAQEEMAKCGQIPVNKDALESDTVKNADFAPFLEQIKTAKSRPTVSCWSDMDSELSVAVTDVMNGDKTAQEAMDDLAEKYDAMLAEENSD